MEASTTEVIRRAVLQRLGRLQTVTGLPAVFGGAVEQQAVGGPPLVISEVRGLRTPALSGLEVLTGTGLGGRAMGLGRVCSVDDYSESRMISHEYDRAVQHEGIVSALAAPVRHGGKVVAVLYAASRSMPVGETAMRAAEEVAERVERDLEQMLPDSPADEAIASEVVAELRAVASALGSNPLRPRLERALRTLTGEGAQTPSGNGANALTARQVQILRLVSNGLTNREIAAQTGLADATVKTYIHDAMRRLQAHTRTRAVFLAQNQGLL